MLCGQLASTMPNLVKLHTTKAKLQHFKHLKIDKNLHANMEDFHRASHILQILRNEIQVDIICYLQI